MIEFDLIRRPQAATAVYWALRIDDCHMPGSDEKAVR